MFEESVILPPPKDRHWVSRLCMGNYIWLVKEKEFAIACAAYSAAVRTAIIGSTYNTLYSKGMCRLTLKRFGHGTSWDETWSMDEDGRGFDYGRLILPVEGHLLDEISPKIIASNGYQCGTSPCIEIEYY